MGRTRRTGAHITDVNAAHLSLISKLSVVTRVNLEAVQDCAGPVGIRKAKLGPVQVITRDCKTTLDRPHHTQERFGPEGQPRGPCG